MRRDDDRLLNRSKTMDLKSFCETDPDTSRKWLLKPLSSKDWSYATDGRIIVRVPRCPDVPEDEEAGKKCDLLFEKASPKPSFAPAPKIELPPAMQDEECASCDGRGHIHDCPTCGCKCPDCNGTGWGQPWHDLSFGWNGR